MRISDWSSDVCSSDLETPVRLDALGLEARAIGIAQPQRRAIVDRRQPAPKLDLALEVQFLRGLICRIDAPAGAPGLEQIGRASCRERVCQSVYISEVAGSLKKK